jgi:hypothetical protein
VSLCLAAVAAAAAAPAAVERGTIVVNRGAHGVALGMTRKQVLARLGRPIYENKNGYMQYARVGRGTIFDVYLDLHTKRVRLLSISGRKFCTREHVCLMRKGGVATAQAAYGRSLHAIADEDGTPAYVIYGRLRGRSVFTTFEAEHNPQAQIFQLFVGFCNGPCPGR